MMMKRTFVNFRKNPQALEMLVQGACGEWFQ